MQTLKLTDRVYWCGVLDPDLRTFDIIMHTEFGTTYNSYLIKGDNATALIDASKACFSDEWLDKVNKLIGVTKIDYLIVNHTEPDHSGAVEKFCELNPDVKIIATTAAIGFLGQIANRPLNTLPAKEGQTLDLGGVTLKFMIFPNLHWPDTMFTYAVEEKLLFSCDCFGSHYSFGEVLVSRVTDCEGYKRATKYYFDNILGPFKRPYLANAVKKVKDMDIAMICPGHGPVLDEGKDGILAWYDEWMEEAPKSDKKKAVITYVTAYGYTRQLAEKIGAGIKDAGADVESLDLTGHPELMDAASTAIAESDGFLLGTPTIVGEALKPIWDIATSMFAATHKGKIAAAFGSYGWTGEGVPNITERLKQLRLKVRDGFRVRFKPTENDLLDAYDYGYDFGCALYNKENDRKAKGPRKLVKCLVCGDMFDASITVCPVCGADKSNFIEVEDNIAGFSSDKEQIITIIGGGEAAFAAAKAARARSKNARIIMLSREKYLPYFRPMLTKTLLASFTADQLGIEPEQWYKDNDIIPLLEKTVKAINTQEKTIELDDGARFSYDKLIYALGAENFIPPIAGLYKDGAILDSVISIRTIDDAEKVRYAIENGAKKAVVIGGGVLGLEAAWQLKKAKLDVTVLEAMPRLMPKQLDEGASAILKKVIESKEVKIVTGAKILAAISDILADAKEYGAKLVNSIFNTKVFETDKSSDGKKILGVLLEDGKIFPCDLLIISTGVRASTAIAKEAGIACGRGVTVDEFMKTSAPDVFAAGDCAEFNGVNYALWSQAASQGEVAGANAVGDELKYEATGGPVSFSGFDTSLFAVGDNGFDEKKSYRTLESRDSAREIYEKYYFAGGHLVGAITVGVDKVVPITKAVQSGASIAETAAIIG
ncbi:MAG TPA: FAD-dependent oxidoreductase [Clostridiales bacterium]|nr:FAD-dependent oxidoreductase [Clostridiales bacterium]